MPRTQQLAIMTFLLLFSFIPAAARENNINISHETTAMPGEEVKLHLHFFNNGARREVSRLETEGLTPDFRQSFIFNRTPVETISLQPGDDAAVELTLAVPAAAKAGKYPFAVKLTTTDGKESDIRELLTVQQTSRLDIGVPTGKITGLPGRSATIPITVTNHGTKPEADIRLSLQTPRHWETEYSSNGPFSLNPGETVRESVTLFIPKSESPGIKNLTVTLSQRDSVKTRQAAAVDVRQPVGILMILLGLITAGLAALLIVNRKYGRR